MPATAAQLLFENVLRAHARQCPDKVALADDQRALTYRELVDAVDQVAAGLRALGTAPGDRVLLALGPSATYLVVFLGALAAGAVAAPLNTRLAPPEVAVYGRRMAPSLVVTETDLIPLMTEVDAERVLVAPSEPDLRAALGRLRGRPGRPVAPGERDPATIFPTGGTTGLPKGAVLSHSHLWLWLSSGCWNGMRYADDVELFFAPFFHVSLLVGPLTTIFAGGTVVLHPTFDVDRALESLARDGITRFLGSPTMFTALRQHPGFARSPRGRIRTVIFGSMPSSPAFIAELRSDWPNAALFTGYSATEFGPVVRGLPGDLAQESFEGLGRPLPGVDLRIVDDEGHDLGRGAVGEIAVRSPWQTDGYLGQPDETARTYGSDGFIRVGDLGTLRADGWLTLAGRRKEMIITGGENVFPAEVERVLHQHPEVADVAVFSVPDGYWGERVEAAVVLRPGARLHPEELRHFARGLLAGYKIPKRVHRLAALPLTAVHKVDRRALQAQLGGFDAREAPSGKEDTQS